MPSQTTNISVLFLMEKSIPYAKITVYQQNFFSKIQF